MATGGEGVFRRHGGGCGGRPGLLICAFNYQTEPTMIDKQPLTPLAINILEVYQSRVCSGMYDFVRICLDFYARQQGLGGDYQNIHTAEGGKSALLWLLGALPGVRQQYAVMQMMQLLARTPSGLLDRHPDWKDQVMGVLRQHE